VRCIAQLRDFCCCLVLLAEYQVCASRSCPAAGVYATEREGNNPLLKFLSVLTTRRYPQAARRGSAGSAEAFVFIE
jgi:hypothetical protein